MFGISSGFVGHSEEIERNCTGNVLLLPSALVAQLAIATAEEKNAFDVSSFGTAKVTWTPKLRLECWVRTSKCLKLY